MKHTIENIQDILTGIAKYSFECDCEEAEVREGGERVYNFLTFFIDTLRLSETQYNALFNVIEQLNCEERNKLVKTGYEFCFSYDISGFDYWNNKQEEENHIWLSVEFSKDLEFDKEQFEEDIQIFYNKLDGYCDIVVYHIENSQDIYDDMVIDTAIEEDWLKLS